jgi:hypothetical protein
VSLGSMAQEHHAAVGEKLGTVIYCSNGALEGTILELSLGIRGPFPSARHPR